MYCCCKVLVGLVIVSTLWIIQWSGAGRKDVGVKEVPRPHPLPQPSRPLLSDLSADWAK